MGEQAPGSKKLTPNLEILKEELKKGDKGEFGKKLKKLREVASLTPLPIEPPIDRGRRVSKKKSLSEIELDRSDD
jgi:hypothetical protein